MKYFTFINYIWYCNKIKLKKSDYKSLEIFRNFCYDLDVYFGGNV